MTAPYWPGIHARELQPHRVELLVQRLAREECPDSACCAIGPMLESCVEEVVSGLWFSSRVTGYVPVLALRRVRECLRAGTCDTELEAP